MVGGEIPAIASDSTAVPEIALPGGAATATTDLAPNLALPWVVRLRYGMVAGEVGIILGMWYGFRLERWALTPGCNVVGVAGGVVR